jgi:argininosuccinate synthase
VIDANRDIVAFAPVREWGWSREEEIDYAIKHNIPVGINHDSPYFLLHDSNPILLLAQMLLG